MAAGKKTGGRTKGTPNKTTKAVRDAISEVADRLGGVDRIVEWARADDQNERAFWVSIYPKLLPLQMNVDGKIDITKIENVIVDPADPDS